MAERCAEDYKNGHDVIVVLSAMGDTTDDLIAKAKEINLNPSKREMDMLLTTGEQISVSLMAMAFHKLGIPAVSLNAFQVKMHSTSTYGNARFKKVESERILHELGYRKIVIVTGFQGVNKYEDYATMGRGGSDTTAVAIAAALGADACEIYTDVDGVYTADPRIVPSARKLKEISYDEMQELASMGANVLHNRSVEMAKKYGTDETLAARAGILHDVTKALNAKQQLLLAEKWNVRLTDFERANPQLLHAKTGAAAAREIFGECEAVQSAIEWHTTGKPDMTKLEKIVYLADMIEPNRTYPGVEAIRAAAEKDLDEGVLLALERTIAHLQEEGFAVCEDSVRARAFLLSERKSS